MGCHCDPERAPSTLGCAEFSSVRAHAGVFRSPPRHRGADGAAAVADRESGARVQPRVHRLVRECRHRHVPARASRDGTARRGGGSGSDLCVLGVSSGAFRTPAVADDRMAAAEPVGAPSLLRHRRVAVSARERILLCDAVPHRQLLCVLRPAAARCRGNGRDVAPSPAARAHGRPCDRRRCPRRSGARAYRARVLSCSAGK